MVLDTSTGKQSAKIQLHQKYWFSFINLHRMMPHALSWYAVRTYMVQVRGNSGDSYWRKVCARRVQFGMPR